MKNDIDELDLKILAFLEGDLPLKPEPFKDLSNSLEISQEEVLNRINFLMQKGYIRRIGAILRHRKYGYKANAMVVWKLNEEQLKKIRKFVEKKREISHAYERVTIQGKWEYNFFTMIHGRNKKEPMKIIREIVQLLGTQEYAIYKSVKEFKKSSPVYARRLLNEREKKF